MVERSSRPKRPRDLSQRAKMVVDVATGEVEEENPDEGKNPLAASVWFQSRGRTEGTYTIGPALFGAMMTEHKLFGEKIRYCY